MKLKLPERFKFNKALAVPVLALVVGTGAALLANRYIKSTISDAIPRQIAGQTVDAVVSKANLMKGTKLDNANLAVRKVPAEWMHSNAVTPAQFSQIKGLDLVLPAKEGELLLWSQIEGKKAPTFSARLVAGRRAVTVSVDEISSISGMVSPGDTIDIVASTRAGGERPVMVPVLQAVHVLATGTRVEQGTPESGGASRSFTTVTLDVTPQEARRIMSAREVGRITALLRAPGDRQNTMPGLIDARAELGLDATNAKQDGSTVPVLSGGGDPRRFSVGGAVDGANGTASLQASMTALADMSSRVVRTGGSDSSRGEADSRSEGASPAARMRPTSAAPR